MPATDREIALHRIASAVVARYLTAALEREAAWNMDMLARLSLLEGAAGVAPGTWLRQQARGFGAALDHFGPKLPAAWTSATSQGLYDKAIATATRLLRGVSGTDASDLVQDMIEGSTSSSGPARKRLFYSVGAALKKYENDLTGGEMTPQHRRVKGTIDNWVTRAARDVIKSWKEQRTRSFGPTKEFESFDPTRTRGTAELDNDERANLLLLAMQSPRGPGVEIRRIIDQEIGRGFTPAQRPIVRAFLEKIGQPKYRSPSEMKRLVSRFTPNKWFTQAYNLVRKEIMDEQGVSAQQLTNALGGNASKVFKFMQDKVGGNARVKKIIEELANEIELLEPVVSRVAARALEKDQPSRHSVVRRWLEKKEREANLTSGNAFASIGDSFEMNEHKNWDEQVTPHVQHSRGSSPLRVASVWMEARRG